MTYRHWKFKHCENRSPPWKRNSKKQESIQSNSVPSRHQVLYRLREYNNSTEDDGDDSSADGGARPVFTTFMDSPEVVHGPKKDACLRCSVPLDNFELHLAVNPDISFIVFRDYDKTIDLPPPKDRDIHNYGKVHLPGPASESIYPVASDLKEALSVILNRRPEYRRILGEYEGSGELSAPYLFIYHNRHEMEDIKGELSAAAQDQLGLLLAYVTHVLGDEYDVADSLLGRKEILPEYVKYLFKPDDILVERVGDEYAGYIAENWPSQSDEKPNRRAWRPRGLNLHDLNLRDPIAQQSPRNPYVWKVKGMACKFDGRFYRIRKELEFEVSPDGCPQQDTAALKPGSLAETQRRGKAITDLRVFPLRYAPDGIVDMLRKRGDTFWRCRTRRLVSYQANEQEEFSNITDDRYMIDMKTFRTIHGGDDESLGLTLFGAERDNDAEVMSNDQPPDDRYLYLLPPRIKGFNLRRKKWHDLAADRISDTIWNREAFKSLVMERRAKDLIQALVVSQLETEKSTDLIAGKGNGLILLLHGGPGTGKTLTAESVAEIAEKPLYRVTCGDVGTKPEAVEKYLESVLHLGRIWGCVVLLDEADVFLEQRSLEDLERNALVSVFLRVLEYYDGILILTSNRVGTFDDAFRSRIQLALHYPNLGPQQRFRIWQTFIDRLERLDGEAVDIADLRDHIGVLKDEKLNGREIRNVITTARQYAQWKHTTLTYDCLKDVIEVSGRFDTYLDKLHGGYTQDELAQDDGLRLA